MIDRDDEGLQFPDAFRLPTAPDPPSTKHLTIQELALQEAGRTPAPAAGASAAPPVPRLFSSTVAAAPAASAPPKIPAAAAAEESAALHVKTELLVQEFTKLMAADPSIGPDDPVHLLLSAMKVFLAGTEEMVAGLLGAGRTLSQETRTATERWSSLIERLDAAADNAEKQWVELTAAGHELQRSQSAVAVERETAAPFDACLKGLHLLADRLEGLSKPPVLARPRAVAGVVFKAAVLTGAAAGVAASFRVFCGF